ncbi:MAG: 5'-Nucleotidase domain protein [Bacteroidetes bacterium]|nr:5'-Nucleotidase domain protein [Bacteroidota bacterium]
MLSRFFYIFLVCALITSVGLAAEAKVGAKAKQLQAVTGLEDHSTTAPVATPSVRKTAVGPGVEIGVTGYDYTNNNSADHNIINFGDGTLSIGRNSSSVTAGYPDRGTWYSYFDGSAWSPYAHVETARRGFGAISQLKDAGGIEVTCAHSGANELEVNVHDAKGGAAWTSVVATGAGIWPAISGGGDAYIHLLSSDANPPVAIVYDRTPDGGTTWDKVSVDVFGALLPGGPAVGAESYDIAAEGALVAAVTGVEEAPVILKWSTDNGDTWTSFDILAGIDSGAAAPGTEVECSDGAVAVVIGPDNLPHVVFSTYTAVYDDTANVASYYSLDAGLWYWKPGGTLTKITKPPVQDTLLLEVDGFRGQNGNYASTPDIGVDAAGNLYVSFQGLTNVQDDSGNYVSHVYLTKSTDGGATWSEPADVTPGTGFDATFPSIADLADPDGSVHIVYNSDPIAGNSVQGEHGIIPVSIMYLKAEVTTDVRPTGEVPAKYVLNQNYPNPFNPTTMISYSIPARADVRLTVYDVLGREVSTLVNATQEAGTYVADFSAQGLPSGVYYYALKAGAFTETKAMVLMK